MSRKSIALGGGIVSMVVSLAIGSAAAAGSISEYSPLGVWEGNVSGRVDGVKIVGLAEVRFFEVGEDTLMEGFGMARLVEEVIDLEGSWNFDPDNDRKIEGTVEVDGVVMELTGRARTDRWIHVKADGPDGNRLRMHGKPFVSDDLPDSDAFYETYEGSLRVGGDRGGASLTFRNLKGPSSLFEADAETTVDTDPSETWEGVGIVNRNGRFIISMNLMDGGGDPTSTFVSLWGHWRDSRPFSAQGKVIEGDTRTRVRLRKLEPVVLD